MKCEYCNGKGYTSVEANSSYIYYCQDCDGTGKELDEEQCDECGRLKEVEEVCEYCEEDRDI